MNVNNLQRYQFLMKRIILHKQQSTNSIRVSKYQGDRIKHYSSPKICDKVAKAWGEAIESFSFGNM